MNANFSFAYGYCTWLRRASLFPLDVFALDLVLSLFPQSLQSLSFKWKEFHLLTLSVVWPHYTSKSSMKKNSCILWLWLTNIRAEFTWWKKNMQGVLIHFEWWYFWLKMQVILLDWLFKYSSTCHLTNQCRTWSTITLILVFFINKQSKKCLDESHKQMFRSYFNFKKTKQCTVYFA